MTYLTFEEYQANGGRAEQSAFPALEFQARRKLDYWTQNRIITPGFAVRLCMTLIVDALAEARENHAGGAVSSFNNDGVSVSFGGIRRTEAEIMRSVYDQVVEILPAELVSVVIK